MFIYDPLLPVPTVGGGNLLLPKCGPQDQSGVEDREDVLSFTSDTLTTHVAVTGRITVTLFVSSNATDTDFAVKVTDVFPAVEDAGGQNAFTGSTSSSKPTSMLVQDGIARMRWREGPMAAAPTPLVPGQVYNVTVDLGPTSYIFNPLHRIRVTVSSSNFPRFSANPNTGRPLSDAMPPTLAINTVFHDTVHQSYLELPVVRLEDQLEL